MEAQQLRPGQIFRLYCRFIEPPKPKFLVLAYIAEDGRGRLFAINSEATEFQRERLADHQIVLEQADYPGFLRYNSVLCLSELLGGFSAADLEDVLLKQPECLIGQLTLGDIAEVRDVVATSTVLAERDKLRVLAQLK